MKFRRNFQILIKTPSSSSLTTKTWANGGTAGDNVAWFGDHLPRAERRLKFRVCGYYHAVRAVYAYPTFNYPVAIANARVDLQ